MQSYYWSLIRKYSNPISLRVQVIIQIIIFLKRVFYKKGNNSVKIYLKRNLNLDRQLESRAIRSLFRKLSLFWTNFQENQNSLWKTLSYWSTCLLRFHLSLNYEDFKRHFNVLLGATVAWTTASPRNQKEGSTSLPWLFCCYGTFWESTFLIQDA